MHIIYPKGGFFWNDGNVVTTSTMRVTHESLRMEWPEQVRLDGRGELDQRGLSRGDVRPGRSAAEPSALLERLVRRDRTVAAIALLVLAAVAWASLLRMRADMARPAAAPWRCRA